MNQDDKLYRRLQGWVRRLSDQVIDLHGQRFIYDKVQRILRDNPLILENVFLTYLVRWYTDSMSISIRKLRDADETSISFMTILKRLKANPCTVSRTRFLRDYKRKERPNEIFDKFAGVGNEYLDRSRIDMDIVTLRLRTKTLSDYADRIVDHNDGRPMPTMPTFEDLSKTIDYIGGLHDRYLILLTGEATELTPVIMYEWEDLFRIPWIPQREHLAKHV